MSPWQPFTALQDPTPSSLPASICNNLTVLNIDDGVALRLCPPRSHPLSLWSTSSLSVTAHIFAYDFPSIIFHSFSFHISYVTLAPVVASSNSFRLTLSIRAAFTSMMILLSCLLALLLCSRHVSVGLPWAGCCWQHPCLPHCHLTCYL